MDLETPEEEHPTFKTYDSSLERFDRVSPEEKAYSIGGEPALVMLSQGVPLEKIYQHFGLKRASVDESAELEKNRIESIVGERLVTGESYPVNKPESVMNGNIYVPPAATTDLNIPIPKPEFTFNPEGTLTGVSAESTGLDGTGTEGFR